LNGNNDIANEAEKILNTHVFEMYGCSESGAIATRQINNVPHQLSRLSLKVYPFISAYRYLTVTFYFTNHWYLISPHSCVVVCTFCPLSFGHCVVCTPLFTDSDITPLVSFGHCVVYTPLFTDSDITSAYRYLTVTFYFTNHWYLISPHSCVCPKPGPGFQMSYVMVFFMFNNLRWLFILLILVELLTITV
jgi:hypothetical protein